MTLRDFIYLDPTRLRSLAGQLGVAAQPDAGEALFLQLEPRLDDRNPLVIDHAFDFARWTPETFPDGQLVRATGAVRLLDFDWLSQALTGLPAVLRKMSKLEMEALRNSDEGRRMSKTALQQRQNENQTAIGRVEEFKMSELNDVVRGLYPGTARVKLRPNPADAPGAVLVASTYTQYFADSPPALAQKYGVDVDANWTIVGHLNAPNPPAQPPPIPTGNKMEDAFEQIAILMNNAFKLAASPTFPALSLTPLAIYRDLR